MKLSSVMLARRTLWSKLCVAPSELVTVLFFSDQESKPDPNQFRQSDGNERRVSFSSPSANFGHSFEGS